MKTQNKENIQVEQKSNMRQNDLKQLLTFADNIKANRHFNTIEATRDRYHQDNDYLCNDNSQYKLDHSSKNYAMERLQQIKNNSKFR